MGNTDNAGAMSIAAVRSADLSASMAQVRVQRVQGIDLAWQHAGLITLATSQRLPLQGRQGSGVSSAKPAFQEAPFAPMAHIGAMYVAVKRNRTFEDHTGPRVRPGTG